MARHLQLTTMHTLDSVEIEAIPACINYNQMASNITSSSADLTWELHRYANCFNVEYGPTGFIQGTGVGALSGTVRYERYGALQFNWFVSKHSV